MKEWKEIELSGKKFKVSNFGDLINTNYRNLGIEKPASTSLTGAGYVRAYGRYVHRIVYEAWFGPIPEGYQINHKDGNKENNHISNLELVTPRENIKHGIETGLIKERSKPIVVYINNVLYGEFESAADLSMKLENGDKKKAYSTWVLLRKLEKGWVPTKGRFVGWKIIEK